MKETAFGLLIVGVAILAIFLSFWSIGPLPPVSIERQVYFAILPPPGSVDDCWDCRCIDCRLLDEEALERAKSGKYAPRELVAIPNAPAPKIEFDLLPSRYAPHTPELTPDESGKGCSIVEEGVGPFPYRPAGLKETGTFVIRCGEVETRYFADFRPGLTSIDDNKVK